MKVKLEDVCEKDSSNLRQADVVGKKGDYPIFGAAGYIGNVDFYHQENPYVAVVKDGAGIGRTTLHPAKSSVIGTMQYLLPKTNILPECLCYIVQYMHLERYFSGATIPHIYFKDYKNEELKLYSLDRQKEIVSILGKIGCIIKSHQQQLQKLDELIKARFIEMFGTIDNNIFNFKICLLADIATEFFAGGDKPTDCIQAKDDTHLYAVFANGYENEGLQGYSQNCRVDKTAVTISARGTIGYCFIRKPGFTPAVRLITIVPNDKISVDYLKYAIDTMQIKSSGTSQAQLTVPEFKCERIILPPQNLQAKFSTFVRQINQSKQTIQSALDKAQLLFDSLMQEYFG